MPLVDLAAVLSNPPPPLLSVFPRLDQLLGRALPGVRLKRVRMKVKLLTAEERAHLAQQYRSGLSIQQAADQFGVHRTTVLKILDELDAHARARKRVLTAEQAAEAVVLYQSGDSLMTVGMRLGVDASTVSRELARAGVPKRERPGWSGRCTT